MASSWALCDREGRVLFEWFAATAADARALLELAERLRPQTAPHTLALAGGDR